MLPKDRSHLLQSFLGGLPGQAAARLAMAVETDRLLEHGALPHDDIMNGLRPALRRDAPHRTPTPLRLFCAPFQDLLTSAPRKAKIKGVIARGTLVPVWNWLCQVLLLDEATVFIRECKALILARRLGEARERVRAFWPVAAEAIAAALATEAGRQMAQKRLGDAMTVADALDMARLLTAGREVEALESLLPAPVPAFTEALVWRVREIYDRLAATRPDAAPYVAVVVMNRLAKPWEALRLPLLVTRHTDEVLISKTDMGLVGEILFARMDALKTAIQQTRHPLFSAEQLMEEVKTFADLSRYIVKEIELRREGEWGKRLLAERVQIGKVMEGFMDRAPREFAEGLPARKGSADFSHAPTAEKRELALRYARLVAGSRTFAAAASFAARQKAAYDELCTALRGYNEDVIRALKAGPADAVVASQYQLCLELTAILFSPEEAELLRRRGRAAQAAAAA